MKQFFKKLWLRVSDFGSLLDPWGEWRRASLDRLDWLSGSTMQSTSSSTDTKNPPKSSNTTATVSTIPRQTQRREGPSPATQYSMLSRYLELHHATQDELRIVGELCFSNQVVDDRRLKIAVEHLDQVLVLLETATMHLEGGQIPPAA